MTEQPSREQVLETWRLERENHQAEEAETDEHP